MEKLQIRQIIEDSRKALFYDFKYSRAYKLLQPLIKEEYPEALYLFSFIALEGESDEDFDQRGIRLLTKAAECRYPPAQHALGLCYLWGDIVEEDPLRAMALFKAAADHGHPEAQLSYGSELYEGENGIEKNEELGLEYIRKAAKAGSQEAIEYLRFL